MRSGTSATSGTSGWWYVGAVNDDVEESGERLSITSLFPPDTLLIYPTGTHLLPELKRTWEEAAPGDVERDLGQCPGGRCVAAVESLERTLHTSHGGLEVDPDALREREHHLLAPDDGFRSHGRA